MTLDIIGIRVSANLRSPYAESRESRDASIHAVTASRRGNQRQRLAVRKTRYERETNAAQAGYPTPRTDDQLTRGA
jgi:hypothetical protein